MRFLLIAVLLLFSVSQVASQPRESSDHTGKGDTEQNPAGAFEGAAKPFSFWFAPQPQVIQIVSEKKTEAKCKPPSEYVSLESLSFAICEVWAYPEASTAFGTLVLAVATFGLAISTHIAARAARISAGHIPRIERAYMFGGSVPNGTTFDNPPGTVKIIIGIKNSGKTPGILIETYGEFLASPPNVSPAKYPFTDGKKWQQDNVYSAGEMGVDATHPFTGPKSETIYFIGYLKFRTVLDESIHTSFWCITPKVIDNVRTEWALVNNVPPGWNGWD